MASCATSCLALNVSVVSVIYTACSVWTKFLPLSIGLCDNGKTYMENDRKTWKYRKTWMIIFESILSW